MEQELPAAQIVPHLVDALKKGKKCFLIESPTGSGKSTALPLGLLSHPEAGRIAVLQPRRAAARLLASRVSSLLGEAVGETVGYRVRGESRTGPRTRLVYMTEGLALREWQERGRLEGIDGILFDEFHERHMEGDLLLALEKEDPGSRWLALMSATPSRGEFLEKLAPEDIFQAQGRTFPLEIRYFGKQQTLPIWERLAGCLKEQLASEEPKGDILVFLPGSFEIRRCERILSSLSFLKKWSIESLYGSLSLEQQERVIAGNGSPRIILSTNLAETSITIPGVRWVIDSGLVKRQRFDPRRGINTLFNETISRASADQRAGRAGRTGPGIAIRLWNTAKHETMDAVEEAEISRLDPSSLFLTLLATGRSPSRFSWLESPPPEMAGEAQRVLRETGAMDPNTGEITPRGLQMASLPCHPRIAATVLKGHETGWGWEACCLAAMVEGRPFLQTNRLSNNLRNRLEELSRQHGSELPAYLWLLEEAERNRFDRDFCEKHGIHGLTAREIMSEARRLFRFLPETKSPTDGERPPWGTIILAGFSDHLGRRVHRSDLQVEMANGTRGKLLKDNFLEPENLLVAIGVEEKIHRGQAERLISLLSIVNLADLRKDPVLKDLLEVRSHTGFDRMAGVVQSIKGLFLGPLMIEDQGETAPEPSQAAAVFRQMFLEGRIKPKLWDQKVERWLSRVNFLATQYPEYGFQTISDEDLALILDQTFEGCTRIKHAEQADPWPVLRSWFSKELNAAMDQLAPEFFHLHCGRRCQIDYTLPDQPVIRARIQDLFDEKNHPALQPVGIPMSVQLLAPNNRPVQTTNDLPGFWERSYPEIRKQLKGRYPKHDWR